MKKLIAMGLISFSLFAHTADHYGQWNEDVDASLAAASSLVQIISDFVTEHAEEFKAHLADTSAEHNVLACAIQ